ncbi:MAG TPA: alpha-(1-_3)-arabinofuranosyltransferase family protein, partial [Kineosporiaceae bacterium]|nr:alpha-(1->3)-arabinofuranosyltransferase family protein [Kineosporiaceae bacterium]
YDLVVVPDPPLGGRLLGTDGSAPRAVPSDLVLALLARLAPADVVEKLVLVAVVALAAAGATRLARRAGGTGAGAAVVAGVVYAWSPYLAERLVLGQWALLLGFAALPWAVDAAVRVGAREPGALVATCAWTVPAAVGGGNAVALLAPVVLVVLLLDGRGSAGRRLRAAGAHLTFTVVVSLPWVLPAVVRSGGLPSDPAGVAAFAAGADTPFGAAGSLVTLGGIWNEAVVPVGRAALLPAGVVLVAVVAVLAAGARPLPARPGGRGVVAAGVLALALAAAGTTAAGRRVLEEVVVAVPGGGLLRDGQKFLAGWVLLVALCAALAVERGTRAVRHLGLAPLGTLAAAALPVAVLPGLAWGANGRLAPVQYPDSWARVRAALAADAEPGAVVVLPWGAYRRFAWNDLRVVLDPAQRISGRPVVQDDVLALRRGTVAGEDARARRVAAVLADPAPLVPALAALGYRHALLHAGDASAPAVRARLSGAACVVCGGDLELLRLGPGSAVPAGTPQGLPTPAALAALGAAGLAALGVLVAAAAGGRRPGRRTGTPGRTA